MTSVVIAARGERLILPRASGRDHGSEEFLAEGLGVIEINSDNQIAAIVMFDPDDFDAAIAELDARYLAGEAADHAHTWSVITRELRRAHQARTSRDDAGLGDASTTAAVTAVRARQADRIHPCLVGSHPRHQHLHRGGAPAERTRSGCHLRGDMAPLRRASTPSGGGSTLLMVDGDLISRCELFDEADLDAAIARFDQLSRPAPPAGKRGKPSGRAFPGAFRGPRLGRPGRNTGRRHSYRRSSSGGGRRHPTRP